MNKLLSQPYQISESDWQKFKAVRLRSVGDSPEAFGDSMQKLQSYPDSYWIEVIKRSKVFVISDNESYVATAVFNKDDDGVWSIKSLWTDPRYRGQGLATDILNAILFKAESMDIEKVELGINKALGNAVGLYESLGFKIIKTLPQTAMGDGSKGDLLVMQKLL